MAFNIVINNGSYNNGSYNNSQDYYNSGISRRNVNEGGDYYNSGTVSGYVNAGGNCQNSGTVGGYVKVGNNFTNSNSVGGYVIVGNNFTNSGTIGANICAQEVENRGEMKGNTFQLLGHKLINEKTQYNDNKVSINYKVVYAPNLRAKDKVTLEDGTEFHCKTLITTEEGANFFEKGKHYYELIEVPSHDIDWNATKAAEYAYEACPAYF
jgi:hypothetical protein